MKKAIKEASEIYQSLLNDIKVKEWPYVHAQVGYCKIREALLSEGNYSIPTDSPWHHAAHSFAEAYRRAPKHAEWKVKLAQVLIKLENLEDDGKGLDELERVSIKNLGIDDQVAVLTNLAAIEAIGERIDETLYLIKSCVERGWVSEALCHNMSVIYTIRGEVKEAQLFQKIATKLKESDEGLDDVVWERTKDLPDRPNPGWRQIGVFIQQPKSAGKYQFHLQKDLGGFAASHPVRDSKNNIAAPESWLGLWGVEAAESSTGQGETSAAPKDR